MDRFSRIWIVQEVAYAKKAIAIHGTRFVPWEALRTAAVVVNEFDIPNCMESGDTYAMITQLEGIHLLFGLSFHCSQGLNLCKDFFVLLCMARHLQSSDPRDKIFALLGLSLDETMASSCDRLQNGSFWRIKNICSKRTLSEGCSRPAVQSMSSRVFPLGY